MSLETLLVASLVLALAWANGANDISKGIATLVGNGTARAKLAVWWGTLWTAAGGLGAVVWGAALLEAFSRGYLQPKFQVTTGFIASVMAGAGGWVVLATRLGLPVSTTHALLGGIVGAGLAGAGVDGLRMAAVAHKAMLPLLLSPLIAVALCAVLLVCGRWLARRVPPWRAACCPREEWQANPFVCAGTDRQTRSARTWIALHWLSSGVTSFARGLNDVPKIAAFLVVVLAMEPAAGGAHKVIWPIAAVAAVMALGALWGGFRVLDVLSQRITPLDAGTGLAANLGTSMLVLAASPLGLPVSTTHVSTGALLGVRWVDKVRPEGGDAVRAVLYGWVVTLPIAALVSSAAFRILEVL